MHSISFVQKYKYTKQLPNRTKYGYAKIINTIRSQMKAANHIFFSRKVKQTNKQINNNWKKWKKIEINRNERVKVYLCFRRILFVYGVSLDYFSENEKFIWKMRSK